MVNLQMCLQMYLKTRLQTSFTKALYFFSIIIILRLVDFQALDPKFVLARVLKIEGLSLGWPSIYVLKETMSPNKIFDI